MGREGLGRVGYVWLSRVRYVWIGLGRVGEYRAGFGIRLGWVWLGGVGRIGLGG